MASKSETLVENLRAQLGERALTITPGLGEVTVEVAAGSYLETMKILRDAESFAFDQLIDLCAVDYSTYGDRQSTEKRYAVVVHLLSVARNQRLRVRVYAANEDFPMVASVTGLWSSANWYEREAFDLFGILFDGHPDLRRILTDYGFVGHPFRKDFPISGHVEMRYDPEQQRCVYQPVTIEPRENTPRVIREPNFGDTGNG